LSGAPVTPRVAMVTLIENIGHGADFSAPVVKDLLELYFGVSG
jgi:hypothetical protein